MTASDGHLDGCWLLAVLVGLASYRCVCGDGDSVLRWHMVTDHTAMCDSVCDSVCVCMGGGQGGNRSTQPGGDVTQMVTRVAPQNTSVWT